MDTIIDECEDGASGSDNDNNNNQNDDDDNDNDDNVDVNVDVDDNINDDNSEPIESSSNEYNVNSDKVPLQVPSMPSIPVVAEKLLPLMPQRQQQLPLPWSLPPPSILPPPPPSILPPPPLIHGSGNDDDDIDSSAVMVAADDDQSDAVKCIFLCEFHATAGPKIAAQVPENYITKELFRIVNRYLIPKAQLERSFLSVSLLGKKILGYPVRIDNKQYARNAFYFNFCFVFAPTTRTVVYEPVVRKLSEYMLSMELSTKMLSQPQDAAKSDKLSNMLAQVRHDLNQQKMCMLQEGNTIIPLSVVPLYRDTPVVHPYSGAVLINEFYKYDHSQWDLTTLRILPYVNGFNHIHRIAAMADVALGLVLDCITHLVLLGVAIVVPVFQYCNVYRPTPKLSQLAKCKLMQSKCIEKCSKSNRKPAKLRDVFRMFASMAHGATFGELCVRFNPAALNINEKQMVLFGLLEGLIRRVDKYPVTVSRNLFFDDADVLVENKMTQYDANDVVAHFDPTFLTNEPKHRISRPLPRGERIKGNSQQQIGQGPQYCYNGLTSFDELCCSRGISSQQLESQLARDRHVIVLLK